MTAQYSVEKTDHIEYSLWLIFSKDGGARLNRAAPSVKANERAMQVVVTLPKSIFKTPVLRATVGVQDNGPTELDINVDTVQGALTEALGLNVDFMVVEKEPETENEACDPE